MVSSSVFLRLFTEQPGFPGTRSRSQTLDLPRPELVSGSSQPGVSMPVSVREPWCQRHFQPEARSLSPASLPGRSRAARGPVLLRDAAPQTRLSSGLSVAPWAGGGAGSHVLCLRVTLTAEDTHFHGGGQVQGAVSESPFNYSVPIEFPPLVKQQQSKTKHKTLIPLFIIQIK